MGISRSQGPTSFREESRDLRGDWLCGNWTVGCSWERWGHGRRDKGPLQCHPYVGPVYAVFTSLSPSNSRYLFLCCENGDFREFLLPGTQPGACRVAFQSWPHPLSGHWEHFEDQQAKACPLMSSRILECPPPPCPPQRNAISAHAPLLQER